MSGFLLSYPRQSLLVLLLLLLGNVSEGLSVASILPLLTLAERANDSQVTGEEEGLAEWIFDSFRTFGVEPTMGNITLVIAAGFMFKSVLLLFAQKKIFYVAARIETHLRLELLGVLANARWAYFAGQSSGELLNAMSIEISRSSSCYLRLMTTISLLITTLIYMLAALAVAWQATLLVSAMFAGIWIALSGLTRLARKAGKRQVRAYRSLVADLANAIHSIKIFKAMARERLVIETTSNNARQLESALKLEGLSAAAMNALQQTIFVFTVLGGIYLTTSYFSITLASIVTLAVLLYRILSCGGKAQKQYQQALVDKNAYSAVLSSIAKARAESERSSGRSKIRLSRGVELAEVFFSYDDRDSVLENLSMVLEFGQLTFLFGPSGAGKSTIVDLIIGLRQPTAGAVRVDGVNMKEVRQDFYRQHIGYVSQEGILLHDTILNNILLGESRFSDRDVAEALESVGATDFIAELENGVHTVAGERGLKLSGGQRQRIMIARALLHSPRLLILDEATNALDAQSEQRIFEYLKQRDNMAILAVSHHDKLIQIADRAYRVEKKAATPVRVDAPPSSQMPAGILSEST